MAPVAGFYDPDSYAANAIDVALFVILLGGFLGVVNAAGAIDTGIRRAMAKLKGREIWMIPILMSLLPSAARPTAWPKRRYSGLLRASGAGDDRGRL